MKTNLKKFNLRLNKEIPVDEFFDKILYQPYSGYYANKLPFGRKGDFITAPTISNLFSEIVAIWFVSTWEKLGKPKHFNLVELGPGDGSLTNVIIQTFKKFPELNKATKIFLYEKSKFLKKIQKNKIKNNKVKWINNFDIIKKGPIIFFGNEFFDAIPIKQFIKKNHKYKEKCYLIDDKVLKEKYRIASNEDISKIKTFKVLSKSKFIEFPKLGLIELDKIIKKILTLSGGILLIDYGYVNEIKENTIQAVMKNKKMKMDKLIKNLGKVDITSLVNFSLLNEYFSKKNLKVKNIVSQKFFLEKMGIIERVKILEKRMNVKEKNYMSQTLTRLLDEKFMGKLFKVIFAFKSKRENFLGFN